MNAGIGPPNDKEYGGDEISALVLDPGYSVTRAGFAGEDTPKSIIPTYYAYGGQSNYVFDDNAIHNPSSDLEIRNPMAADGTVEDWDVATKLWEYSITSRLTGPKERPAIRHSDDDKAEQDGDVKMEGTENDEKTLEEYPLLMTEPGWNSTKNREKMMEIAMEGWGCPASYLSRSAVMASFSAGKPSALVVDIGASGTSVTAVHDGLIMKKGTFHSKLGGNWISDQIRLLFSQSQPPVPITPHYLIASKRPVDAGAAAQATIRTFTKQPHESFRRLQEDRVLTEFKESCAEVWPPINIRAPPNLTAGFDMARTMPPRSFEMPDGWNNAFGVDRYRVMEGLFDSKAAFTDASHPAPSPADTIPGMLQAALAGVDVDLRAHLLQNIVLTGGGSLTNGMIQRTELEAQQMYSGGKVRAYAPAPTIERKYASWIGGSILASLGSFHQMWISKKEYDEFGASIVEKRCK